MLVSIIVPVYNRADEIEDFLASLGKQVISTRVNQFEIVIVDDGSSDNLKDVIKKHREFLKIDYYFQLNKGPGAARNLGMEKASGDWFVFIDSDCTMPPVFIQNMFNHLGTNEFDAFGGPDTGRDDFPVFLKAVNYSMTSFLGTGGTRGSKGKSVAKYYPRSFNMGIKKEVYKKIGGMNKLRHGQDMEFSNRIYRAGFKVKFLSDVFVYHKRRTSLRRFYKQIFNWGVARINLGKIDKAMLKPVHALPAIVVLQFFLVLLAAIFIPIMRTILILELLIGCFVALLAFVESTRKNHSVVVGLLSIITLFTQVFAYGIGFWTGVVKSIFSKDKFVTGFTKKYYK